MDRSWFLIGRSLWRSSPLPTKKVTLLRNLGCIRAEASEGRKVLGWGSVLGESWVGPQMVKASRQKSAYFSNAFPPFSLNEERMREGGKERESLNLNLTFWNFLRSQFISTLFLHKSKRNFLFHEPRETQHWHQASGIFWVLQWLFSFIFSSRWKAIRAISSFIRRFMDCTSPRLWLTAPLSIAWYRFNYPIWMSTCENNGSITCDAETRHCTCLYGIFSGSEQLPLEPSWPKLFWF